jgi:tRNA-2-methylthio-N6-dimethylallyladenosine synthase
MTPKTFKIKSFGCQMNVYDGERMAELLGQQGMSAVTDSDDADLVVLKHLPHSRKGGRKGLFRRRTPETRGRIQAADRALPAALRRPRARRQSAAPS